MDLQLHRNKHSLTFFTGIPIRCLSNLVVLAYTGFINLKSWYFVRKMDHLNIVLICLSCIAGIYALCCRKVHNFGTHRFLCTFNIVKSIGFFFKNVLLLLTFTKYVNLEDSNLSHLNIEKRDEEVIEF